MRLQGSEEFVFADALMGGGKVAIQSPGSVEIATLSYKCPIVITGSVVEATSKGLVPAHTQTTGSITSESVETWYKTLWGILEGSDSQQAINVVGFLYLNLMRLIVKDKDLVCRHIYEKSYDAFTSLWSSVKGINYFPPPHQATVDLFSESFKKFSANSLMCLAAEV